MEKMPKFFWLIFFSSLIFAGCREEEAERDRIEDSKWFAERRKLIEDFNRNNSIFSNMYAAMIFRGVVRKVKRSGFVLENVSCILSPPSLKHNYLKLKQIAVRLRKPFAFLPGDSAPRDGEVYYVHVVNGPRGLYDFYLEHMIHYFPEKPENSIVYSSSLADSKHFFDIQGGRRFPVLKSISLANDVLNLKTHSGEAKALRSGEAWDIEAFNRSFRYTLKQDQVLHTPLVGLEIFSPPGVDGPYRMIRSALLKLDPLVQRKTHPLQSDTDRQAPP